MNGQALSRVNEPAAPLALAEKPNSLAKLDLRELRQLAEIMVESGAFNDIKQVAQASVKIMAGAELGFTPLQSMTGIHFFQGKVEFSSTLKASLVKSSGKYDYEVEEHTNDACAVQFYRVGPNGLRTKLGPPVRYTFADATGAGLTNKDVWKKHPADMLFAACIRQGVRRHCADVLRGVSSDTDVDDSSFNAEAAEAQPQSPQSQIVEHNGDTVDTVTGEVIAEADAPAEEAPSTLSASEDTTEDEVREWVRSIAKLKFGDDRDEYIKFLNDRNPKFMDRDSLIKLHGELAAL